MNMKTIPVRKMPFSSIIIKGNLFPRVVLEDCASFKRKYDFLNLKRRMNQDSTMSEADFDRPVTPPRSPTPPLETLETTPQPSTSSAFTSPSPFASISESISASTSTVITVCTSASTSTVITVCTSASTSTVITVSTSPSTSAIITVSATPSVSTFIPEFTSSPSTSAFIPEITSSPSTSAFIPEITSSPSTSAFIPEITSSPSTSTFIPESSYMGSTASTSVSMYTSVSDANQASTSTSLTMYTSVSDSNIASTSTSEPTYASSSASNYDSTSASTSGPSRGKKRKSWDPSSDYEIERIVGYHRDDHEQMWYFVKWKGWPEEYNTYEPIENMTGCNYLLMKYFEFKKPTKKEFTKKDNEILESLETYDVYLKLQEGNFKKEDLDEFSESCLDISKMFKKGSFVVFCKMIQREYEYIIRCLIGMCTHQDPGLVRRAQNYKIVLKMIKLRRKQLRENLAMQNYISTLEGTEVKVENYTDLDIFPQTLTYVVDLKLGENIVMPNDPTVGCDCEGGCTPKSKCCGEMASTLFAYNRYGRVRSLERFAIYECNRRCKCPPECPNRIVQHGMKVKLCIFKTELCGWGVKALEKIPKGTFICEYVGELITDAEAVVRDIEYYKKNSSYVFDLDYSPDHEKNMCCIDATKYGNLARFVNHSCDPNLVVYPVWIDCLEPNLHRLAFFARRNIKKNEELSIDYENAQDGQLPQLSKEEEEKRSQRPLRTLSRIRCQCGAPNCREWVFGN